MSNLIPQQRADKNGKLVTRHVKVGDSSSQTPSPFPAPELTPIDRYFAQEKAEMDALLRTVGENFGKANMPLTYSHLELLEGTKAHPASMSLLEALAEATDGIDESGASALLGGFSDYQSGKHEYHVACLELAARAYKFCRKVDDSIPHSADPRDTYFLSGSLGTFAKDFFEDNKPSHASDPDDVADFEGAYFLDRLDLNDKGRFNTEGAYFRALRTLKERRDDIIGYMPLLIAARMISSRDYMYLSDILDLMDYLKTICPPEKSASVAAECVKRRVFDVDTIEQIAKSDTAPLIGGVL